jgi:hypothetical protein
MDPKNNANPAAPDDEQNTPPQADAQQDAMPSLGDETVQGTDVGNGSPAPAVTPEDTSADASSASVPEEAPAVTPDTSSNSPEVAFGAGTEPSIASEEPAAKTEDVMPPAPDVAPESTAGAASDINTPTQTMPSDQQVPSDAVPPVAPTPTPGNDKKTILVLGVVAAILLVAIAVLYFVV